MAEEIPKDKKRWEPEYKKEGLTFGDVSESKIRGFESFSRMKQIVAPGTIRILGAGNRVEISTGDSSKIDFIQGNNKVSLSHFGIDSGGNTGLVIENNTSVNTNLSVAMRIARVAGVGQINLYAKEDIEAGLVIESTANGTVTIKANAPFILKSLTADPSSPSAGMVYFNTTSGSVRVYNGTNWKTLTYV